MTRTHARTNAQVKLQLLPDMRLRLDDPAMMYNNDVNRDVHKLKDEKKGTYVLNCCIRSALEVLY